MIRVVLLGHIRTSVGLDELEFPELEMDASLLVDRLRGMSREENPGFNRFNVIAMVEEGEAFVPASATRKIRDGDRVALIPFSHGG
jgi:molybdopterin converting factor small subunit